jgi:ABC-type antimicrobial peptide transport system permease subunit
MNSKSTPGVFHAYGSHLYCKWKSGAYTNGRSEGGAMVSTFSLALATSTIVIALAIILVANPMPFRYAVRNLFLRWRTTILTTLAFATVVGLQTVMLAFVKSMYLIVAGSGRPCNVIVLSDGATDEIYSSLDYSRLVNVELHSAVLRNRDGIPLASREIYVIISQPMAAAPDQPARCFIAFRGLDDAQLAAAVHELSLHPGGAWFSRAGVQAVSTLIAEPSAIQAVIGQGLARELGKYRGSRPLSTGDVFEAGLRRWVVVGVLQSAGTTFDMEVWADRQQVGQTFNRPQPTTLVLRTADGAAAGQLAHDLSVNYREMPVNAVTECDYYRKLNGTNQQFFGATAVVAFVLCIGATFGTMNTMFAAVAQRTKETGLLRVLGFLRRQILVSFLFESMVMAAAGGLVGCALAFLADGWAASSVLSTGQGAGTIVVLRLNIDRQVLLAGMLIAMGMGLVGALPPAVTAARLRPLEAMR